MSFKETDIAPPAKPVTFRTSVLPSTLPLSLMGHDLTVFTPQCTTTRTLLKSDHTSARAPSPKIVEGNRADEKCMKVVVPPSDPDSKKAGYTNTLSTLTRIRPKQYQSRRHSRGMTVITLPVRDEPAMQGIRPNPRKMIVARQVKSYKVRPPIGSKVNHPVREV